MYRKFSQYLEGSFVDPAKLIADAEAALQGVDYDTMIGTGLSGLLVIPTLARAFGKEFAIVRKDGDSSHREVPIEGTIGDRWIFVDDFTSSGATQDRVIGAVEKASRGFPNMLFPAWQPFETEYVGTYMYARRQFVKPIHRRGVYR